MAEASIFKNNRNQAVRLPQDMALPEHVRRVRIFRIGNARLIAPAGTEWDDFFDGPAVTDDFMAERDQPPAQERDTL